MAEAALLALSKIGSYLAGEAATYATSKLSNLKALPDTVQRIRRQLLMMNLFIRKMGASYLSDELLNGWIAEVRMLAYRVEDVMDSFSYYSLQFEQEKFLNKMGKGPNYAVVFSRIADELIQIEKEIEHVSKLKALWVQSVHELVPNQVNTERRLPQYCLQQFIKDEDLVGFKDTRQLLAGLLSPNANERALKVISVLGMGGVGKTTLVTTVYERQKENFDLQVWLTVSQSYSVESLLRNLLEMIRTQEQHITADDKKLTISDDILRMSLSQLKTNLKESLKRKKYIVVLDDVWDRQAYDGMRDVFEDSNKGSRVIITTRKGEVAAFAHTGCGLELEPLEDEDALQLFCAKAFPNKNGCECPSELQQLATNIVKRCGGLPLPIVSIGSLLSARKQIEPVWKQMYDQLPCELEKDEQVRGILTLSYYELPGDLRNCFLYCSLFPEDTPLSRENLVRLWIAEGFVVKKGDSTLEEVAEGYLMELVHRNMLQLVDNDELGRVKTCRMHDILRELALSISKEEMFGTANDFGAMVLIDSDVRRLSACQWRGKKHDASKIKFPHLRTLMAGETIAASIPLILSESKYLTVLELQDSGVSDVHTSIGTLFNLRYIGLRNTAVKSLPDSIEKLSNLQTLDVKSTNIEKLPNGIVKLAKLRHLLADKFIDDTRSNFLYFCGVPAPEGLSRLEELQTLETVQATEGLGEQLEKMMQLRNLWIDNISTDHCNELFSSLSKMPLLSSLLLCASDENEALLCFKALNPTSTILQRLIIRGRCADKTLECPLFKDHGRHLKYLALSWCRLGEDPLALLALLLPNLTYLRLNKVHSADTLVLCDRCFPHLKTLVLKHMPDVKRLEIGDGALPCIEGLYIVSLPKLSRFPRGIESLSSLKKLWLLSLHRDFKADWNENEMYEKMKDLSELRV